MNQNHSYDAGLKTCKITNLGHRSNQVPGVHLRFMGTYSYHTARYPTNLSSEPRFHYTDFNRRISYLVSHEPLKVNCCPILNPHQERWRKIKTINKTSHLIKYSSILSPHQNIPICDDGFSSLFLKTFFYPFFCCGRVEWTLVYEKTADDIPLSWPSAFCEVGQLTSSIVPSLCRLRPIGLINRLSFWHSFKEFCYDHLGEMVGGCRFLGRPLRSLS